MLFLKISAINNVMGWLGWIIDLFIILPVIFVANEKTYKPAVKVSSVVIPSKGIHRIVCLYAFFH